MVEGGDNRKEREDVYRAILNTVSGRESKLDDGGIEKGDVDGIDGIIRNAVIISCIIGFLVAMYFVFAEKESFSVLYIKPDSYSNYVRGNEVSFIYGVKCFENKKTRYVVEIFLGDVLVGRNEFEMENGEREWNVSFKIPENLEFPTKVRVVLRWNNQSMDSYFWLRGREYG